MAVFLMISTETVKSKDIDFNFVLQGVFFGGGGAVCLSQCISIASIGPSVTLKWISG